MDGADPMSMESLIQTPVEHKTIIFTTANINMININLPIVETKQKQSLNFLIDTGASISIIKIENLHRKLLIQRDKKFTNYGIKGPMYNLRICDLTLKFK